MATLNHVLFIGHVGKDPEISTMKEKLLAKFSLAVDQGKDQPTMWLQITAWEKQAEFVQKHVRKGAPVFIQGQLLQHKYMDKTQVERISYEVKALNVQLLGERPKEADVLPA
jgi:single-strand DNA-binding protein